MKQQIIAAALATALWVPAAQAALFDFSFRLAGGDILAGQLEGTLQADNNRIIVDAFLDFVTFNGAPQVALPFVQSLDVVFGGVSGPLDPIVTLDGSFMDIVACNSANCGDDGFGFAVGNAFAAGSGFPIYISGSTFGNANEPYSQPNWSLTGVPLPATLPLLLIGAVGLAFSRRRRG